MERIVRVRRSEESARQAHHLGEKPRGQVAARTRRHGEGDVFVGGGIALEVEIEVVDGLDDESDDIDRIDRTDRTDRSKPNRTDRTEQTELSNSQLTKSQSSF